MHRRALRFRESIRHEITVLEEARSVLRERVPEAQGKIRTVARALRDASALYGFDEITAAAAALERADAAALLERLEILLDLLQELLTTGRPPARLRALLVGNGSGAREAVLAALPRSGADLDVVDTGREALERLLNTSYGLLLVHLALPDMDGRRLIARLRRQLGTLHTPLFVLAPEGAPYLEAECRALGADLFVAKPLSVDRLRESIAAYTDEADRPRPDQPRTDPLSGLRTRTAVRQMFEEARLLARSARFSLAFALFRIDGHAAAVTLHGATMGDLLVRRTSEMLRRTFDRSDLLVRWSTDEFAALLIDHRPADLLDEIRRLQAKVAAYRFQTEHGLAVRVTLSCAVVDVLENASYADVVSRADRLLAVDDDAALIHADHTGPEAPVRTVLLVMPESLVPSAIRHRLEQEAFDVVHAPDHVSAIEAGVMRDDLDLALVDADLRGPDGRPTVEHIGSLPGLRDVPVVLVLERGEERQLAHGFGRGASDYLTRPFSASDLLARLHFVLKKHVPTRPRRRRLGEPPLPTAVRAEDATAGTVPAPVASASAPSTPDTPEGAEMSAPHPSSEPILDALAQVIRSRLAKGEPVSVPSIGRLRVEFKQSSLQRTDDGRVVLHPPRHTIEFTPE